MEGKDFFTPIANTKPYLKASFEGFPGSGKTFTGIQLAIALHQRIKSTKPIALFDTEKAGKFLIPFFKDAGVEVVSKESRSLDDLVIAMKTLREKSFADILFVDSITHVYDNLIQAYLKKKNRLSMQLQDYPIIETIWQEKFLTPLVDDPYHLIFCGRAGWEYEDEVNEESGRRTSFKSGIKMRAQRNTEFDADLTVLMEQDRNLLSDDKSVIHTATILKDRSTIIHGKTFKFLPDTKISIAERRAKVWEVFQPVVDALLGAANYTPMVSGDDTVLVKTEEDRSQARRDCTIQLEEIQGLIQKAIPGQTAAEKTARFDLMEFAFHTRSWTRIEGMDLEALRIGYQKVFARLIELGLVDRMPTQEQRDRLAEILTKYNIHGVERLKNEDAFKVIATSADYERELERTEADLATRPMKAEPKGVKSPDGKLPL